MNYDNECCFRKRICDKKYKEHMGHDEQSFPERCCNIKCRICFFRACANENMEMIKCYVKNGVDIYSHNNDGLDSFRYACTTKKMNVIKYFIECGILLNNRCSKNRSYLDYACMFGNLEVVKMLVENGAQINLNENEHFQSSLYIACCHYYKKTKIIEYLIDNGADVNNDPSSLFQACVSCPEDIVRLLINKSNNLDIYNDRGYSLLYYACHNLNRGTNIIKLLVEKGCNINHINNKGETCIFAACYNHDIDVVKYLIEQGANVNVINKNGETCIFGIFGNKNSTYDTNIYNIVKVLIENGMDINVKSIYGKTFLHYACTYWNDDVVNLLLDNGANIFDKSLSQETYHNSITNLFEKQMRKRIYILSCIIQKDVFKHYIFNKIVNGYK